ncbi:hypothetical protein AVEN_238799-1 [Araneus ventricosus]|uniref:Uncharacterized protein n=1 Tax=Araneus ventricosus TaxID=182803 RepID=A0A4Y2UX04_ARAVE|nr:hypothetical protein AVEN_238799-1 [Araneus ventricosus]
MRSQDVVLVDQTAENRWGKDWLVNATTFTLQPRLIPKRLSSDDEMITFHMRMRQQPNEFYAAGIGSMIKRWDKFINIGGDYVEE